VTTGPAIDLTGVTIPENVEVRDFVPHAAVLPDASLTVSHAGLGTVHAALAAGVPLVCIPHGRDQEDNAARVVAAEAGIRLRKGVSAEKLAKEIEGALADPKLKEGAVRLAKDFGGRDGAAAAVAEIEALGAAG
jgi:UDP:flavonoid glycosyltransferase YjiC (YdhE family)